MNPAPPKQRSTPPPIKVVVVEDETWMRENLVREINAASGFCCINHYRTAEEAVQYIPTDRPDVVLMDINLPGMNGVDCIRHLRTALPDVKCLMLTVYEESEKIFNSLLAGASGYLLKRTGTPDLLKATRRGPEGGPPMPAG